MMNFMGKKDKNSPNQNQIEEIDEIAKINFLDDDNDTKPNVDALERSSELFTQLDSMIQAVQHESSAMDAMREKLRELDNMKSQLSALTKRLLEADQNNLYLKGSLMKLQDAYSEMKKSKQTLESQIIPIRNEYNRSMQMYKNENIARLSAQQENTMLKERIRQLEEENNGLLHENKSIPSLNESLDIVKSDLSQLRQKYKQDRKQMEGTLRRMEDHSRALEFNRNETRKLAMNLLECTDGDMKSRRKHALLQQQQQQQQHGNGNMPQIKDALSPTNLGQNQPNLQQYMQMQQPPGKTYSESPDNFNAKANMNAVNSGLLTYFG